jgi:hypothetical protein
MHLNDWTPAETTTHQDHVIAHVIGATVLGHFVWDETAFLLLDIGFIWHIYLDGEMGLVPHPVAVNELEADEILKSDIRTDVDLLLLGLEGNLKRLTAVRDASPIHEVAFKSNDSERRLVLTCERGSVCIETSLASSEVRVMSDDNEDGLADVVEAETEFVREQLRAELGREPTEEELNEWLREHTESY